MPSPARGQLSRRLLLLLLVLPGLMALGACASDSPYPANDPGWLRAQEQHLLDVRAKGIRTHDEALFMQGVARGDKAFVARQRRYFANMVQLPLARFRYVVTDRTWPGRLAEPGLGARARIPRVQQVTELRGFDTGPVRRTTGFVFAQRHGQLMIVADRTRTGALFPGYDPAPWDLVRVVVRRSHGVLGVFGRSTAADADRILPVVAAGVHDVQAGLPFSWPGRVVVYCFENRVVLNSFAGVPGGNIGHLGALTFPVRSENGSRERTVGMRFTLLPSSLGAGQPFLGRIVRHELTHVALGPRDDGAPVWFAEGIAEYMGARPLPRDQRRIASVALTRAREPIGGMPASSSFNGPDQDWHYALSWMACDYIAATRGESTLWALMDAFHNGGIGTRDNQQDAVLQRVLGLNSHQLAERAAARIRRIYG
ncbi:hypothetical protein [Nocardioides terrisoli]|uniref:hypothetical protein n=1 Tax=Nocardioides terrisoli TaxID=3388267 RepID=UPI00287BB576|nr:hypothetical protein [Nocardioides marmorisolisilvae]